MDRIIAYFVLGVRMYHLLLLGKAPAISAVQSGHRRPCARPKAPAATSPPICFKHWQVRPRVDHAGNAVTDPWAANIAFDSTATRAMEPTERFLAFRLQDTARRTRVRADVAARQQVKS
jgi:hypothetical protein